MGSLNVAFLLVVALAVSGGVQEAHGTQVARDVQGVNQEQVLEILKNVPEEEWKDFLWYNLIKGYEMEKQGEFEKFSDIKPELSLAIYQYITSKFLVTDTSLRSTICFPSGCIDLDDPGVHPF